MAEIDAEVKKTSKKAEKQEKPCLAGVGLPTEEDMVAAGATWEDDEEWGSSASEAVPATGFWDTPAQAKKEKKKPSKKALKKEKKEKKKNPPKRTRRRRRRRRTNKKLHFVQ